MTVNKALEWNSPINPDLKILLHSVIRTSASHCAWSEVDIQAKMVSCLTSAFAVFRAHDRARGIRQSGLSWGEEIENDRGHSKDVLKHTFTARFDRYTRQLLHQYRTTSSFEWRQTSVIITINPLKCIYPLVWVFP
jgi:hypothetical protein